MSLSFEEQQSQTSSDLSKNNNELDHADGHENGERREESSTSQADAIKPSEPLFQIKKWNLFAFWKWDAHSDICAICRANVMEACPTCQSENISSECVIVWGTCNHSFHNCCIIKWVKRNKRCPLCQKEWKDCKKRQLN